jgi:hypothetical protein
VKKNKAMIVLDPNRKIKYVAAVVALTILIIALACFIYSHCRTLNPKQPIQAVSKEKKTSINEEKTLDQRVADIIKTGNLDLCQKIEDQTFKTVCTNNIAFNLAKEKDDPSYCQKLDNNLMSVADCEREVVANKALGEGNISICEQASDESVKDQCKNSFYWKLALTKDDINICNQIQQKDQLEYCHNNYLINKKFRGNTKGFDCLQLEGNDVQVECKKMQDLIGTINTMHKFPNPDLCSQFKTSLFNNYCLSFL